MNLLKSLFNAANLLSLFRIFLSYPLYISLTQINKASNFSEINIFLFACLMIGLTDILDGYFARLFNTVTDIGKFLDPLADKICVLVLIIFLSFEFGKIYSLLFVVLLVRDLIIVFFSIFYANKEGIYLQANSFGKLFLFFISFNMLLAVITIPEIVKNNYSYLITTRDILYFLAIFCFIFSSIKYFSTYINLIRKS